MKKFMKIATTVLNSLALTLVISSANAACCWMFHQPEFPKEAEKFKKVHQCSGQPLNESLVKKFDGYFYARKIMKIRIDLDTWVM